MLGRIVEIQGESHLSRLKLAKMNCDLGIVKSWSQNLIGQGPEESEKDMKKLMIAAAAALCATVGFGIESANIVGYNTATIQGTDEAGNVKWHLLAIQFKDVTGNDDSITLKDALQMTSVPAYEGNWKTRANAPTLQIWDGSGFVSYLWVAPACSGLQADAWVTGTSKVDVGPTTKLKAGDAIWLTARGLGTGTGVITFSGSVKTEASSTVAIGSGAWNMGSNPYPTTYNINDIVPSFAAYDGAWKTRANAPTLQIWDGSGFVSYLWVAPACSGLEANAWVTGTTKAPTTDTLAPGAGFWFKNVNGVEGTLTFNFSN